MSWSVSACGLVGAVRKELEKQFVNAAGGCNGIPHEERSCELARQIVDNELEALDNPQSEVKAVDVKASGSATRKRDPNEPPETKWSVTTSQFDLEIKPLWRFIGDSSI